jgi:hypothetical protein
LFLVQKPLVTVVTSCNLPIISYTYVFAININFCAYLFLPPMGSYAPSLSSNSCFENTLLCSRAREMNMHAYETPIIQIKGPFYVLKWFGIRLLIFWKNL